MFQIPITMQPAVSDRVPVLRDIVSVEISPAGAEPYGACADITVQGFVSGKTIDFGSGHGNQLSYSDINNATIVFTVVSEGFDSSGNLGTITRTVYGTSIVRQPYPSNASNQDVTTTIRIALSEFIYNDDKNGGTGTSGVDPKVTIKFGAIKNEAAGDEISNPVTNFKCINSSGLDYASCIARWDRVAGVCTADRVTSDFTMACRAYHRFGIACVRFDTSGQTSGNIVTSYSTTRTKTQRTGSGLYAEAYHSASTSMTGNTQAELIDLRFRAYPLVGDLDSVRDSNAHTTSTEECLGYNKATIICDKSGTLNVYAVVDATSGNNTTGATSTILATAETTPYLNIGEAIKDGSNVIYLLNGTHNFVGSSLTRRTTNEWVVVTHHPSLSSRADAIVSVPTGLQRYYCERLQIKNVTYRHAAVGSAPWGNNQDCLRLNLIDFDKNGIGAGTISMGEESVVTYFDNCIGDLGESTFNLMTQSSDRIAYCIDGCDFGSPSSAHTGSSVVFEICATKVKGSGLWIGNIAVGVAPDRNNFFMDFNEFLTAKSVMLLGDDSNITGAAIIGNIIESTVSTSTVIAEIAATNQNTTATNMLFWHNSWFGERENLAYDGAITGAPHRHVNWSVKYNCFEDTHTKGDVFNTNASFTGGWAVIYKVGFLQNHDIDYTTNTSGGQEWLVLGFGLTTGDPGVIDDNSSGDFGDAYPGTGNGNYTPDTGSTLIGRIPTGQRVITCDLYGNSVVENGDIGAIQVTV